MKLDELRLEAVRALLQQEGFVLPAGAQADDAALLQAMLDALCELSSRDGLTGILNRRAFNAQLEKELDRVARSGDSDLLLLVDIDHFKRVNDTLGHLAGDAVIRSIAHSLTAAVRPMDTVARIGGEEFAVLLPGCTPQFGHYVAERIRREVEEREVVFQDLQPIRVTVSCGGAFAEPWERTPSDAWLARADEQLYRAKHSGRNCVCLESVPLSEVSAEEKHLLFAWTPDGTSPLERPHP